MNQYLNSAESSLEERIQIWWALEKLYENNYIKIGKYKCSSLRTGGKILFSKKSEVSDKAAGLSRRVWGQQKVTVWTEIPNQETKAKFSPVYTGLKDMKVINLLRLHLKYHIPFWVSCIKTHYFTSISSEKCSNYKKIRKSVLIKHSTPIKEATEFLNFFGWLVFVGFVWFVCFKG